MAFNTPDYDNIPDPIPAYIPGLGDVEVRFNSLRNPGTLYTNSSYYNFKQSQDDKNGKIYYLAEVREFDILVMLESSKNNEWKITSKANYSQNKLLEIES